jgi:hypothetical protein
MEDKMAFKKIFVIWLVITALAGGLFYATKIVFHAHPLWAWAFPVLYPGALILFALYVLTKKKE